VIDIGAGQDLGTLLAAFWRGSLGTSSAVLSGTLVRMIPLAIVGVGIAIAFRAGVFNIGGEGQFLFGAIAGVIAGQSLAGTLGSGVVIVMLLAGAVAGGALAGVAAWLRVRFGVLEVISTIMLNFVAANLVSYLVRGPLQEPTRVYPQTETLPAAATLPRLVAGTRLHAGIVIAVVVCVVAWWFLSRTADGFRIRAVGASRTVAAAAGRVDVRRVAMRAMMISGALAGLAGATEVAGVTFALYENLSPGYGFAAIAVAILARLNPLGVLPAALLFATLETGALGLQRDAGIPSVAAMAAEAVAILIIVGVGRGWSRPRFAFLRSRRSAPAT